MSHPHLRHVVATEPGAREHRAMAEEEDVHVAEVADIKLNLASPHTA